MSKNEFTIRKCVLVKYNGAGGDVVIPDSVTSIGDKAFYECRGLTSVTIPDSVTSIGRSAFGWCRGLTSVTIPDSVTSIGDDAFSWCDGLTSVTIPDSVTSIGKRAFYMCRGLTSLTIGGSLTRIDDEAFYGCYKLVEVYNKSSKKIKKGSTANGYVGYYAKDIYKDEYVSKLHTDENGYIIYTDGNLISLIDYTGNETNLILPSSITEINQGAFFGCSSLTSVTIPDSVTSIGDEAFHECSGLTSVTIGGSVTSIGDKAFEYCYKLVEVYNKSSLNITNGSEDNGYVGYYAKDIYKDEYASKLHTDENGYIIYTNGNLISLIGYTGNETNLILPSSITEINQGAFSGCSSLTSVTIPDSVTRIGRSSFEDCSGLMSVTIGGSVTSIGDGAFILCDGLTSVNYAGTKEEWNTIKKGAYWDKGTGDYIVHCTDGDVSKRKKSNCDDLPF